MHILLIAPQMADLNQVSEIRAMTRLHRVSLLNGHVTLADLEQVTREETFDVIHFAMHLVHDSTGRTPDYLVLSDTERLEQGHVAALARQSGTQLAFFNVCESARMASFLVSNGVPSAMYTTIEIADASAWVIPLRFYQALERMERNSQVDMFKAFQMADSRDGSYGFVSGQQYYNRLIAPIREDIEERLNGRALLTKRERVAFAVFLALISALGGVNAWLQWLHLIMR